MNLRVALLLLGASLLALLIVIGASSLLRWLKQTYPQQFPVLAVILCLGLGALGIWGFMEIRSGPALHTGDLLTLQEPVVARSVTLDGRLSHTACIIDIYEHLSVIETGGGILKARVESNPPSGASYCPVGAEVQIELAWLHRFTLTHRHS